MTSFTLSQIQWVPPQVSCAIHRLAAPFLFVAQACTSACCSGAPTWWRAVDFVFLVVSGFAVYRSMQTSSKKWVWRSLWAAWGALTCSVLAEAFAHALFLPALKYTVASALIGLHVYNMKFANVATQHAPSMKVDNKLPVMVHFRLSRGGKTTLLNHILHNKQNSRLRSS